MFIGHFGAGLGIKKAAPALSLGLIFIAVQFLDLLWPTLVLLNIEHVAINTNAHPKIPLIFTFYPYSHSCLMAVVWSLLFGGISYLITKNSRTAWILGLCVFSHWFLDLLVHVPDLPLYPGNAPKVGLGLWNVPALETIIEGALFIGGLLLYPRTTRPLNKKGSILLWILVALLVLSHIGNMMAPPPRSTTSVALGAELMWIFVALAFWTDHNRTIRSALPANKRESRQVVE
jgi:hypothetical protein